MDTYFLEDFIKIKFKHLQKLYLNNNEINNIKALEKANFNEIKEFDISYNNIENRNIKGLIISSL